jgi:hypothetical protein
MNIRIFEEKVLALQRKLEDLLSDDEELRMKASRGMYDDNNERGNHESVNNLIFYFILFYFISLTTLKANYGGENCIK